tara:strand:+ start:149 stop:667 length:519 start_codon:yes stop_codon:yes gene_type:complete
VLSLDSVFYFFFSIITMLKILGNNFALAAVVSLILVLVVFIERRNSDKKNNTKSIKDWIFWARLYSASYLLVLLVLFMKDRCPITGGGAGSASCSGNSCSMLGSLKSRFYKPSGGGASAPAVAVSTAPKVASTPSAPWSSAVQAAPQVSQAAPSSDLRVIDLNNVNISDPDF